MRFLGRKSSKTATLGRPNEGKSPGWSMSEVIDKLKKQKGPALEGTMVIGIDFGTTYSGVAWATIADFEASQINSITRWPGTGIEAVKAPTKLVYQNGKVVWGYEVPADAEAFKWFKLLLLRDDDLEPELRSSPVLLEGKARLRGMGKTPTDLIADYLRELWNHAVQDIQKTRGQIILDALAFHVVITVPAIWKDYARREMQKAAQAAGIYNSRSAGPTTISFVPEPEAAALATLCDTGRSLKTDEIYVICDAGGGTVDLISYRIGHLNPIELHEAAVGTGGLCGGAIIDEEFEKTCKRRLEHRWGKLSSTGIAEIMQDEWEQGIKPKFQGDPEKKYIVSIPAEAFGDSKDLNDDSRRPIISKGRIHFRSSDIQKVFTNVFEDIYRLINDQVRTIKARKDRVKGIILVGGLGSSPYLYQYLKKRYKSTEILQDSGAKPRAAICRGAIYKGFIDGPSDVVSNRAPVKLVSTVARQSIGVTLDSHFDKKKHLEEDRFWDDLEGVWLARHQMVWYIEKGENVSTKQPVRHSFYRSFSSRESFSPEKMSDSIYQSNHDQPPFRKGSGVQRLCKINYESSFADGVLRKCHSENGKTYWTFNYEIEMVPSGASTLFQIYHQGKILGSQNVDIEFS